MWLLGSSKATIIAIVASVIAIIAGGSYLYNKGYDSGVAEVEHQVQILNEQWSKKVQDAKIAYDSELIKLNQQHAIQLDRLNSQNAALVSDNKKLTNTLNYYFGDNQKIRLDDKIVIWHDRAAAGEGLDEIIFEDVKGQYTLKDLMVTVATNYTNHNICYQKLTTLQQIVQTYIDKQEQLSK